MKNIIYKTKMFVINHYSILILLLFLILSISWNINMLNKLGKYENRLYGTYMMQGQSMGESEYFVFEKDKFYHYIQFKVLDKGDYNEVSENVYSLKGENEINDFIIKGVLKNNEVIYFKDKNMNNINVYSKISDVPTFINVEIKNK